MVGSADEELPEPNDPCDTNIFIPYVAGGDGVVHGDKDLDGGEATGDGDRYPELLKKWLVEEQHFPYCAFNTSYGSTTTDDYQDENHEELDLTQQSLAWDLRPTLLTLQVGRENTVIKEHISTCLDQIKDHRFIEANVCAAAVLAFLGTSTKLRDDLSDILNQYKVQMAGNPQMVVAVLGYMNPYPRALDVTTGDPRVLRQARRHHSHLPDPVGPAATGAGHPRPDRQGDEQARSRGSSRSSRSRRRAASTSSTRTTSSRTTA